MTPHSAIIADDDRLLGDSLCDALGDLGWLVSAVRSGTEAMAELRRMPRDLLLSDVDMPGLTGFQLLAWSRDLLPRPQVILMSARATPELADTARRSGAITLLAKPVAITEIASLVDRHFPAFPSGPG